MPMAYSKDMASNELETVTIKGISYVVLQSTTPEGHESQGRTNTARHMRKCKQAREVMIVRPTGAKVMRSVQFESGSYSQPTDLFFDLNKAERADLAAVAATLAN